MAHLASRFAPHSPSIISAVPLSDDQIRAVAPSIYAQEPHGSRSERYTYIPTSTVLAKLRENGFQPFMCAQTRVRSEDRREFTKHMLRLRHASQTVDAEAHEIILLNSHDGTSSYQMLSGLFRFVCKNGLVCGDVVDDIRVTHKGDVADRVVEGAFTVLDGADLVREVRDDMRGVALSEEEQTLFARSALQLKYDLPEGQAAPITERDLLGARRFDDGKPDLWSVFNRVQENSLKGGLDARTASGRRARTRAVTGIDQGVKLNRALWMLAEGMRQLKR